MWASFSSVVEAQKRGIRVRLHLSVELLASRLVGNCSDEPNTTAAPHTITTYVSRALTNYHSFYASDIHWFSNTYSLSKSLQNQISRGCGRWRARGLWVKSGLSVESFGYRYISDYHRLIGQVSLHYNSRVWPPLTRWGEHSRRSRTDRFGCICDIANPEVILGAS